MRLEILPCSDWLKLERKAWGKIGMSQRKSQLAIDQAVSNGALLFESVTGQSVTLHISSPSIAPYPQSQT